MRTWTKEACENIDATVFSGDEFYDKTAREAFKKYLQRWDREIRTIEAIEELPDPK